ncbi:amidase signature enzyme [Thozetella sp. PMI_491]|nr:amidase signature enzyme [Thozetella sp. PMI_491]
MSSSPFDPLTTNAVDLQRMLEAGQITSVQIVESYLQQIERHEPALNALISISPAETLRRIAAELDEERRQGRVRGPLHGIPIVLKDCFITASDLGMPTTAGAVVFAEAKASKNAAIVQRMLNAGLIILAKGNMTEYAGMKTSSMMPGFSPQGGQTMSPYVGKMKENERLLGHTAPGGSSTGPAVSVAAGYSPLAMGTETIGSIVTPSVRTGLYALKPTVGAQDATGMYRMTDFYDSPGPMAKCATDVMNMAELLLGRPLRSADTGTWSGVGVAFLDPTKWSMAEAMCEQFEGTAEQMKDEYEALVEQVKTLGCTVQYPATVGELSELTVEGKEVLVPIAYWDFNNICIDAFIKSFDECPVTNLDEIIKYNEENKMKAMPAPFEEQNDLIKALGCNEAPEVIAKQKEGLRAVGKKILDTVLDQEGIDLIAAPGDSPLCIHAAASGYPVATVPLGQLKYNKRPFGVCLVAKENNEEALLRFMAAYERTAAPRPVPAI